VLGAVGARNELVDNAAALRAWDAEGIGEAPGQAVAQIQRRGTLSPWPPISGERNGGETCAKDWV
jgi:hypothetical protein